MVLISRYSFNGNTNDSLGASNGTGTNITWVDGKSNQAAGFLSSGSGVNTGNISYGTTITVGLWLKIGSTQQDYANILCKRTSGSAIDFQLMLAQASGYGSNRYKIFLQYYNSGAVQQHFTNINYTNYYDKRAYLVFTIQAGVINFYINGQNDGSTATRPSITSTNRMVVFGSENSAANTFFSGVMDEVEIYNHVLTPGEIQMKYLYYLGYL